MSQATPSPRVTPVPIAGPGDAAGLVARSPAVDATGLEERAASMAARPIDQSAKRRALQLAIRCMDLTSLEGSETADTIVALCATAVRPDPVDASVTTVAAVCLYPQFVPVAMEELRNSRVAVAGVAGGFPSGLGPLEERLAEIREVVAAGADEIDIVLNRSLFMDGRYAEAFEELVAAREAADSTYLKVILETGELGSYDRIRQASDLVMAAGADFIKTSTGKVRVNATLPTALCMMEAVRDFHEETGRAVGVKVAGGIRKAAEAIRYIEILQGTLGPDWLAPERFRLGASSLLGDIVTQLGAEPGGD